MEDLKHLLGTKEEKLNFLPSFNDGPMEKNARRHFNEREKIALIEEPGQASNRSRIDVAGTHYEDSSVAEIAQMIMPLKGL